MRDPRIGLGLIALGVVLVVVGLVVRSGEDTDPVAAANATTVPATTGPITAEPPPTTVAPATATSAPTTTALATTTTARATTTVAPTTTTAAPDELIRAFIVQYAAATDSDDAEFLYSTMHPTVIAAGGEELCRNFVDAEIVLISDYQLIGPITGPVLLVGNVEAYQAEVSFSFQGQQFTDNAAYAVEDGSVRWFSTCR
jgi:hypothetical protein